MNQKTIIAEAKEESTTVEAKEESTTKESLTNSKKTSQNFQNNIQSIGVFVKVIGKLADKHDSNTKRDIINPIDETFKTIDDMIIKTENEDNKTTNTSKKILVKKKERKKFFKLLAKKLDNGEMISDMRKAKKASTQQGTLLRKNSLITLMSTFETLVSNLIQEFYNKFPNALPSDNKTLSLSEIKDLGSIEEAEKFLIDSEIDSVLRGDIVNQINYFVKPIKLNLKAINIYQEELVEASQRRNILVHNDGIVNRHYLKKAPKKLIDKELKEGTKLKIDSTYLINKIELIHVVGIILIQECFRKWEPKEIHTLNDLLLEIIYDELKEENYSFVEKLSKYINTIDLKNDKDRRLLIINHCIALKEQNKIEELNEILEKDDWTCVSDDFNLALAALKNNSAEFYFLLDKLILTKSLKVFDLQQWPLFNSFREEKAFKKIVKKQIKNRKEERKKRQEEIKTEKKRMKSPNENEIKEIE